MRRRIVQAITNKAGGITSSFVTPIFVIVLKVKYFKSEVTSRPTECWRKRLLSVCLRLLISKFCFQQEQSENWVTLLIHSVHWEWITVLRSSLHICQLFFFSWKVTFSDLTLLSITPQTWEFPPATSKWKWLFVTC